MTLNNVSKTFKTWGFSHKIISQSKAQESEKCCHAYILKVFGLSHWNRKKQFAGIYGYLHLQSIISEILKIIYIYMNLYCRLLGDNLSFTTSIALIRFASFQKHHLTMQGELIVFVLMIMVIKEASALFKNETNP